MPKETGDGSLSPFFFKKDNSMSYPKPLSEKTIARQFAESFLTDERIHFLHTFFQAAANLYGVVSLWQLWEVYKELKEKTKLLVIRRKDLIAFSAIARRENLPYRIYEIDEIYTEEEREDSERMIVRKDIIWPGFGGSFAVVDKIIEMQMTKPFFVPEDFLSYTDPVPSQEEKELKNFLDNLKVNGKRLRKIHFLSEAEKDTIAYYGGSIENAHGRNKGYLKEYLYDRRGPESDKIFRDLEFRIKTGWTDFMMTIRFLTEEMNEVGVIFSEKQLQDLVRLLSNYQNSTHMYCNCGWTPSELRAARPLTGMPAISIGPGIRKMIADGELDIDEMRAQIREMGMETDF